MASHMGFTSTIIRLKYRLLLAKNEFCRALFSCPDASDGPGCRTDRELRADEANESGWRCSVAYRSARFRSGAVVSHQSADWSCRGFGAWHISHLASTERRHTHDRCGNRGNFHRGIGNRYAGYSQRRLDRSAFWRFSEPEYSLVAAWISCRAYDCNFYFHISSPAYLDIILT